MAIDTLEKRYASLTFGCAGRAGTREPVGISSAFRRAAALGIYGGGGSGVTETGVMCVAASSVYIPGTAASSAYIPGPARSSIGACR